MNYAKAMVIQIQSKHGQQSCFWKSDKPLNKFWCQIDVEENGEISTVLHHYISNANTEKLYFLIIETLKADWALSWPTVESILRSFEIDPNY